MTLWGLWGLHGVTPRQIARKYFREIQDNAAADSAAQLAYYFLFSLFPFLFFLVTISAYLPIKASVDAALERAGYLMPDEVYELLKGHLDDLLGQTRPKLLTVSLLTTLWTASRGVDALRKALNLAYHVTESRPWWRTQMHAMAMTLAGTALLLVAVALFAVGGGTGEKLFHLVHLDHQYHVIWSWLRWPFTAMVVTFVAALLYYSLPDVKQEFRFITPGSVLGAVFWLAATWGFTFYVEHFGHYNVTYGSLGGVVILLLWLYMTGLIFILGGELNSVVEHLSSEGKAEGARAPGEAPAVPTHAVTVGAAKSARAGKRLEWRLWRRWLRKPRPT